MYLHLTFISYLNYSIGFAHIGRVGSVSVTISIALERYLSVSPPTTTTRVPKYLLFPTPIAFTILYNLPKFFEIVKCTKEEMQQTMLIWYKQQQQNVTTNYPIIKDRTTKEVLDVDEVEDMIMCDIYDTRTTSLRNNKWYIIFYVFLSEFVLIEIIPWILVIILNIKTWKGIRNFRKKRKTLKNNLGKNIQGK